uniref:SWIM-type domain-containing protein n=1 Tax=Magallana gigas TaxID=29159 RepID=A0A8W8JM95_MAGGI|nr:uncharacterized protein LOC117691142 [Crassostrea gigas]
MAYKGIQAANRPPWRHYSIAVFEPIDLYFAHRLAGFLHLQVDKVTGDSINSRCECPAGCGPHSSCKHVAAVALMRSKFVSVGSPVKAEDLPMKRGLTDDYLTNPSPVKYGNKA